MVQKYNKIELKCVCLCVRAHKKYNDDDGYDRDDNKKAKVAKEVDK